MTHNLSILFLVISIVAVTCSLLGRYRATRFALLRMPFFFISWWTSELAWLHAIIQSILVLVFAAVLGFEDWYTGVGLVLLLISVVLLLQMHRISGRTHQHFCEAYAAIFGNNYREKVLPERQQYFASRQHWKSWLLPFRMARSAVKVQRDIAYGDHPRHRLDIFQSSAASTQPSPVILQIHGGGWVVGDKAQQGQPLLHHLAARGWVGVAMNYRRAPKYRFPEPLVDSKRALAWVKQNIADYGGDPDFVVVTGGSAGGHLALLTALTPNRPEFQPGFEVSDTSLAACVSFYAVYDFCDRYSTFPDHSFNQFLTRFVMPKNKQEAPELWEQASPIAQISENAPPIMLIHGSNDLLVPVEQADIFAKVLAKTSKETNFLVELPATQHAFDVFHSVRTDQAVDAVQRFLEIIIAESVLSSKNRVQ